MPNAGGSRCIAPGYSGAEFTGAAKKRPRPRGRGEWGVVSDQRAHDALFRLITLFPGEQAQA